MDADDKAKQIFEEVQKEMNTKDAFKKANEFSLSFRDKYFSVLGKLDKYFRNKCWKNIQWLEENTEKTPQGPRLKDKTQVVELETNIEELTDCLKKYDTESGIDSQKLLAGFDNHMNEIGWKFKTKFDECKKLKEENSMRNCFREMENDNLKELINFYNHYSKEFDNLDSKL